MNENKSIPTDGKVHLKGIVFNIQRFSIHDGPGIRTVVFLKGCPLNCLWCSNPESQEVFPRIFHDPRKCMGCNACILKCHSGAISQKGEVKLVNMKKCNMCGNCLESCYSGALELVGKEMTVEEVMSEIRKDRPFYFNSGGGVTLSGGEPSVQYEFAARILDKCSKEGIDTALETSGYANWSILNELIQRVNLVLFDIKHMNPHQHKIFTGVDNKLILENAKKIASSGKNMIVRVPVIPKHNDDEENIRATMNFTISLKTVKEIHLLPYHRLGKGKYNRLGREYPLGDLPSPEQEDMERLRSLGERMGLITQIGG